MAAPVQAEILVHIRALLSGMPQVQAFMNTLRSLQGGAGNINRVTTASRQATGGMTSLHNVTRQVALSFYSFGRAGHYLSTILFAISGGAAVLVTTLTSLLAVAAGGAFAILIREGVLFNAEIEQLRLGFASLVFSFADVRGAQGELLEGQDKWNRSVEYSSALMDQIFIKTFQTNRTVNELASAFQSGLSPALNAGLSLQQSLDIIVRLVQAADVFKLKSNEINEEVRNLLAGNATRDTRIAVALFGSATAANKAIDQARSQGKLLDLLTEKLEGFQRAGQLLPKTFEGALSNLRDLFKRVAGEISSEFKNELTKGFINVFDRIVDTEKLKQGVFQLRPEFQRIFNIVKEIADELARRIPAALDFILTKVVEIFDYVESKGADGTLDRLADLLNEIAGLIGTIFGQINTSDVPEGFLANILKGATLVVHVVRELFQALNVIAAFIKLVLLGTITGLLTLVLILLGRIIELIIGPNSVSNAFYSWAKSAEEYLNSILDDLKEQYKFLLKLIGAYDDLAAKKTGAAAREENKGPEVIDAGNSVEVDPVTLQPIVKPDLNNVFGKNKSKIDDEKKAIQGLRSALRELTNAKIDLARAEAQTAFDITRDIIRRELELNQQKYDDFKASIVEFFNFKASYERADLAREIKYLEDLKGVERDKLTQRQRDVEQTEKNPVIRDTRLSAESLKYKERILEIDTRIGTLQKNIDRTTLDSARAKRKALEDLDRQVKDIEAQLKGITGDQFGEALERIDLQFKDTLKKFLIEFGEGSPQVQKLLELIQRLKLAAAFDEDFRQTDFIERDRQLRVNELQDQLNRGKITQIEYEREINKLSDEYAQKQIVILKQALAVAEAHGLDRDIILRLKEAIQQLEQSRVPLDSLAQSINGVLRDSISGFFDDLIDGSKSFGDAVRDMASRMLKDIARVLIQALVLSTIFKVLGIGAGSTGGIGGVLSGIFGGGAATQTPGTPPIVPPKFATGVILRGPGTGTSDSILARLSNGEAVIPAQRVLQYGPDFIQSLIDGSFLPGYLPRFANGTIVNQTTQATAPATPAPVNVKVVNAIDPREILNQLRSGDATEILANIFSSNQTTFKQALGIA